MGMCFFTVEMQSSGQGDTRVRCFTWTGPTTRRSIFVFANIEGGRLMAHSKSLRRFSAGAAAVGANALGALAVGAFAIGALAIGRLAIGWIAVQRSAFKSVEIEELTVARLRVRELTVSDTVKD